jgi:hypothetical protein
MTALKLLTLIDNPLRPIRYINRDVLQYHNQSQADMKINIINNAYSNQAL